MVGDLGKRKKGEENASGKRFRERRKNRKSSASGNFVVVVLI